MKDLKDLRQVTKNLNNKVVFKTNGDLCSVTRKKVYSMYYKGERISPFYTVEEWHLKLIVNALIKAGL